MVNASFVFGIDGEDPDVFERTVEWAVEQGVETATFHILTPYPGTALYRRMRAEGRLLHDDWDLYDTRHVVYRPMGIRPEQLEAGYWRAYREFYRWGSILRGSLRKPGLTGALRHLAYATGWKKFEWLWDAIIRGRRLVHALPLLETVLAEFGRRVPDQGSQASGRPSPSESRGSGSWTPGQRSQLPRIPSPSPSKEATYSRREPAPWQRKAITSRSG
jgi:hypothetical protein